MASILGSLLKLSQQLPSFGEELSMWVAVLFCRMVDLVHGIGKLTILFDQLWFGETCHRSLVSWIVS